jgi:hypothetical protein
MMLLETPVLEHFREDIDRFLMREGSIPSFLASVTITYLQDGGRFSQSSSSQPQPPSQPQPSSMMAQRSQAQQMAPPNRGGIEMVNRSESENESSEHEEDDVEEYDEEEPEPDDDEDDDDRDQDDEDDDESDEQEDVIMIDSD